MGNWAGDWNLVAAAATYKDLKPTGADGLFTLKAVPGVTGVYTVDFTAGQMTAAWKGCVLMERAGANGPDLPWPLPASSPALQAVQATQAVKAGGHIRSQIEKLWTGSSKVFARLEGDIEINNVKQGIAIFKVDQGYADGKDFLVVVTKEDLDRLASPDGSAVGRPR